MIIVETERQKLKSMKDLDHLNYSINQHMEKIKEHSDCKKIMRLFQIMAEYSVKHSGMSFMRNKTMAKELKVSVRTIQRYTKKLEQLHVLLKFSTKRKNNRGQASNTYVILPVIKSVVSTVCHGGCHPFKPSFKPSDFNNNHLNNSYKRKAYIKFVPKKLQHFQAVFGKSVEKIYSRVWLAHKKLNLSVDQETMQDIGFIAMEQLKQYEKEGKQLTEEQQCKAAYVIAYKQLTQRIERGEIWDTNDLYEFYNKVKLQRYQDYISSDNASREELDKLGVF
jgi:DNA-binding Lrp family transcriptional regulator